MNTRQRHGVQAAGTAAGAALGQGAYQAAGYSTKHFVDNRTRKGGERVTPQQVRLQDKTLKPLKRQFGMHMPNGSPLRNNVGYHRAYPRELPYGRVIRTLGHTHEGRKGMAVGAAATAAGAGIGLLAARKEAAMHKSAFGVEDSRISKGAVAATLAPTIGAAASAPKGRKLRTAARTTGASTAGAIVGGTVGGVISRRPLGAVAGAIAGRHAGAAVGYRTSQNFMLQNPRPQQLPGRQH